MKCRVELTKKAFKQLKKLPAQIQDLADEAISALEHEGVCPKYWDVKKLNNQEYRIRLNYRYRMKYRTEDDELYIEIFYIGHRKNAYRTL